MKTFKVDFIETSRYQVTVEAASPAKAAEEAERRFLADPHSHFVSVDAYDVMVDRGDVTELDDEGKITLIHAGV
jgi:hypothetical protein